MANLNITIIGCGGGGINATSDIKKYLGSSVEDIVDTKILAIDTSISDSDVVDDFTQILDRSGNPLAGSGSDRGENWSEIGPFVNKWILDKKLVNAKSTHYTIIVMGTGGGSGSAIGLALLKSLVEAGNNVLPILIGDTKDESTTLNTRDALQDIYKVSTRVLKKPISAWYINNANEVPRNIGKINEKIARFIETLIVFASGLNNGMDQTEIRNLIAMYKFKRIAVDPGVYLMKVATVNNVPESLERDKAILARILSTTNDETPYVGKARHIRVGTVVDDEVDTIIGDRLPIALYTARDGFKAKLDSVKNTYASQKSSTKADEIIIDDDEDTGLEF